MTKVTRLCKIICKKGEDEKKLECEATDQKEHKKKDVHVREQDMETKV